MRNLSTCRVHTQAHTQTYTTGIAPNHNLNTYCICNFCAHSHTVKGAHGLFVHTHSRTFTLCVTMSRFRTSRSVFLGMGYLPITEEWHILLLLIANLAARSTQTEVVVRRKDLKKLTEDKLHPRHMVKPQQSRRKKSWKVYLFNSFFCWTKKELRRTWN